MSITGDDMPAVECVPGELVELVARRDTAELVLDIDQPAQALLVGQAVQRARQAVEARR